MDIQVLIDGLKKLGLPEDKFAVFGSGPLGVRGLRSMRNLDIIVTEDLWEQLTRKYPVDNEGFIRTHNLKISNWWWAETKPFTQLIKEADIIDGIRFVKLVEVVAYKKLINGPKEKQDIKLIDEFLSR